MKEHEFKYVSFVDLGLPSGTRWTDINVGTSDKDIYGFYYNMGFGILVTNNDKEKAIKRFLSQPGYIPSKAQWDELLSNCAIKFTDNTIEFVSSINGKSICFPLGGMANDGKWIDKKEGRYWIRSDKGERSTEYMLMGSGLVVSIMHCDKYDAFNMRLVDKL